MNRKITIGALIMLTLICLTTGGVEANYQSSPNVGAKNNTLSTWMLGVRQMEATGQVMGLKESIDTSTLLSSSSNQIDVHLQKNTEYGAMAILAVSDYGKQGNGTSGSDYVHTNTYGLATTTGNASGIYGLGGNDEVVAGGTYASFPRYSGKYYNEYFTYEQTGLVGDAMIETRGWQHGGVNWINSSQPTFRRGRGSLFTFDNSYTADSWRGRAVVVSGAGL